MPSFDKCSVKISHYNNFMVSWYDNCRPHCHHLVKSWWKSTILKLRYFFIFCYLYEVYFRITTYHNKCVIIHIYCGKLWSWNTLSRSADIMTLLLLAAMPLFWRNCDYISRYICWNIIIFVNYDLDIHCQCQLIPYVWYRPHCHHFHERFVKTVV